MADNDGWVDVPTSPQAQSAGSNDGWVDVPAAGSVKKSGFSISELPAEIVKTRKDIMGQFIAGVPEMGAGLLHGLFGAPAAWVLAATGDTEGADAIHRKNAERKASIKGYLDENLGDAKTTAGKVARSAPKAMTSANPVTGVATGISMTEDMYQSLLDQGVPDDQAAFASRLQTVGNAVLARTGINPGVLKDLGINVGAGALVNILTEQYLKDRGHTKAAKDFDFTDAENWMTDVIATMMGAKMKVKDHTPKKPADAAAKSQEILDQKKKEKAAEEVKAKAAAEVPALPPEAPPPAGGGGLPPIMPDMVPSPIDSRGVPSLPPVDQNAPLPMHEGMTAPELPGTEMPPPSQPGLPQLPPLPPVEGMPPAQGGLPQLPPQLSLPPMDQPLPMVEGMSAPRLPGTEPTVKNPPLPQLNELPPPMAAKAPPPGLPEVPGMVPSLPDTSTAPQGLPILNRDGTPALPTKDTPPGVPERPLPMIDETMLDPLGQNTVNPLTGAVVPQSSQPTKQGTLGLRGGKTNKANIDAEALLDEAKRTKFFAEEGPHGYINLDTTLNNVLDMPKSKMVFPGYKALATRVLKHLKDSGLSVFMVDTLPDNAAGQYAHTPHAIFLRRGAGNNDQVLMHELIHAATGRWIEKNLKHPLVRTLQRLSDDFTKKYPELYASQDFDKSGQRSAPHEFIAEVRTNPKVQELLAKEPAIRNALQKVMDQFVKVARKALGLTEKAEMTALDQVLKLSDKVMEKSSAAARKGIFDEIGMSKGVQTDIENAMEGKRTPVDMDSLTGGLSGKVGDALNRIHERPINSTSPLATPEHQGAAHARIPGMKGTEYITNIPVEQVKEAMKAEADIDPSIFDRAIGGAELFSQIKGSSAYYAVSKWWQNAANVMALYDRTYIKPIHQQVNRMFRNPELMTLTQIMQNEDRANTRHTVEELQQLGLSERAIKVHQDFRNEMDATLRDTNEMLRSQGREEVTAREAYIASMFHGNWKIAVHNKEGRVIWFIAETSKGKAKHALDVLAKQVEDIDVSKSKIIHDATPHNREGILFTDVHKAMINILGKNDPLTQKLQAISEEKIMSEGFAAVGYEKHFQPKAGVRGELGGKPWRNDAQNLKEFWEGQFRAMRNARKWMEVQKAMKSTGELLADTDLAESHPNTLRAVRNLMHKELGYGTAEWMRRAEAGFAKGLGHIADLIPGLKHMPTDMSSINHGIGFGKQVFYLKALGFGNLKFGIISLAQPVYTLPSHILLQRMGYDHSYMQTAIEGTTMAAIFLAEHYSSGIGKTHKERFDGMPTIFREAGRYMDANGIATLNQFSEIGHVDQGRVRKGIIDTLGLTISQPEKIARTEAFMTYVSHLHQSGKFKGNDQALFQMAEKFTNIAMGNYKHSERAHMFNELGATGNVLGSLQTYRLNFFGQTAMFGKHLLKTGDPTPLMGQMAVQLTMAGVMGTLGIETIEEIWDFFKGLYIKGGGTDKGYLNWSPKKAILGNLPTWMSMGPLSYLTNRNFASSTDMGTIIDPTTQGMLPVVNDFYNMGEKLVNFLRDPTQATAERLGYSMTPSAGRGQVEMRSKTLTAPGGHARPIDNPKAPIAYKRSEEDKAARLDPLGMHTLKESTEKEGSYLVKKNRGFVTQARGEQKSRFEDAVLAGDKEKIKKYFQNFMDLDGSATELASVIGRTKIREMETIEQQLAKGATTIEGVRKYQEFKKMMDHLRKQ